jgi:hypothetical protein
MLQGIQNETDELDNPFVFAFGFDRRHGRRLSVVTTMMTMTIPAPKTAIRADDDITDDDDDSSGFDSLTWENPFE